ncbi:MAG: class I SAM-dependent methyltransferase [Candidatus Paceibacterota bacterium]|jgi:SAM-dependent methyltransferase
MKILDACCGGRTFWFDKKHPDTLFVDKRVMQPRTIGNGKNARTRRCLPDKVMDFRNLEFSDNTFSLVVFDPPHLKTLGANSYMAAMYGVLDKDTWQEDLKKGFAECFRVLKPDGVLIFKWCEYEIPLSQILKLTPVAPLFGHPSGKQQKTHWVTFMKQTPPTEGTKIFEGKNSSLRKTYEAAVTPETCEYMIMTPSPLHNGGMWCAEPYPCKFHGEWKLNR